MSGDTKALLVLAVWAVVAVVGLGISREFSKDWDEVADHAPLLVMWPMFIAFLVALGAGWCVLWIGRGPVRLVRWMAQRRAARTNLPKAEIARRYWREKAAKRAALKNPWGVPHE